MAQAYFNATRRMEECMYLPYNFCAYTVYMYLQTYIIDNVNLCTFESCYNNFIRKTVAEIQRYIIQCSNIEVFVIDSLI